MTRLPFKRSYWAVPGQLLAGCYPGDQDPQEMRAKLQGLVDAGVTRVISLMQAGEKGHHGIDFVPYEEELARLGHEAGRLIKCERRAVADLSVPSVEAMREILGAIAAEIGAGGIVYIHCWGGRGRTGTAVGCYLVQTQGISGEAALREILTLTGHARDKFKETPENETQRAMVRSWKAPAPRRSAQRDRFMGALLGLAVGDALGTTLEFKSPGSFTPITDMTGGGPFKLQAGEWTDDTSMALCLASSLVECQGFNPRDQMNRYVRWWKEGYLSVRPHCFDIGTTVAGALQRFLAEDEPFAGSTDSHTAGNGSIMRLAPVPLFYWLDPRSAIEQAAQSSRTTHGARTAVDACRYLAGLIVGAIQGVAKSELLSTRYSPLGDLWQSAPLDPLIDTIAAGSFKTKEPPQIRGTGYVVASLEAALWAFDRSDNFRDGALLAANLGEDADTTAAVYGQIAGAYYGESGIPPAWRERVAMRELIASLGEALAGGKVTR